MDETFLEAAERAATTALEEARKRLQFPVRPESFDGSCDECGELVPEQRVQLGYYRCVHCQATIEKKQRFVR